MYCVIAGVLDSAVSVNDFSVFGPFETEAAAHTFIADWSETVGGDDEAIVVPFIDPIQELLEERKSREEALRAAQ